MYFQIGMKTKSTSVIAKNKLKKSDKELIKYRDLQCDFAYSLEGGAIGNALNMLKYTCLAELIFNEQNNLIFIGLIVCNCYKFFSTYCYCIKIKLYIVILSM